MKYLFDATQICTTLVLLVSTSVGIGITMFGIYLMRNSECRLAKWVKKNFDK